MIDWQKKVTGPLIKKFGQPIVYRRGVENYALNGIFDEAYSSVDVSNGMPITTCAPCVGINLDDLPIEPRQRDTVLVLAARGAPHKDARYIIKNVQIDGHGWCRLMLNVAPEISEKPIDD